jgi:hypothetical protein
MDRAQSAGGRRAHAQMGQVKTRWVFPPSWNVSPFTLNVPGPRGEAELGTDAALRTHRLLRELAGSARASVHEESKRALLQLLRQDIRRRNRHVALRHFFMLEACGAFLPDDLRLTCEEWIASCQKPMIRQIIGAVNDWTQMLCASRPPDPPRSQDVRTR